MTHFIDSKLYMNTMIPNTTTNTTCIVPVNFEPPIPVIPARPPSPATPTPQRNLEIISATTRAKYQTIVVDRPYTHKYS